MLGLGASLKSFSFTETPGPHWPLHFRIPQDIGENHNDNAVKQSVDQKKNSLGKEKHSQTSDNCVKHSSLESKKNV